MMATHESGYAKSVAGEHISVIMACNGKNLTSFGAFLVHDAVAAFSA